jgi:LysM repeat protein
MRQEQLKANGANWCYLKRSVFTFLIVALSSLGVLSCGIFRYDEPAPESLPSATAVVVAAGPTGIAEALSPTPTAMPVASPEPTASPSSVPTGSPTVPPPPPTSTPVPCGPLPGWVIYVVQSGDSLFRLALKTGTTVAQVQRANCLGNTTGIHAGQALYLPFIPVPPTLPPPPPTIKPTEVTPTEPVCTSDFCPNPELEGSLTIDAGGPNEPDFVPCESVTEPKIEFDTSTATVELGQRRYFYVCVDDPVSASVTSTDGQPRQVTLLSAIPNPDLQMGNAQAVIDWPALPFEPTGLHTMTVSSADGTVVDFVFLVLSPTTERILTVPPLGPPGTTFQVYYVNFDLNTTPTFEFYGEDEPVVGGSHELSLRTPWEVNVDQPLMGVSGKGWAQKLLDSEPTDARAAYSITYDNKRVFNLFWLK